MAGKGWRIAVSEFTGIVGVSDAMIFAWKLSLSPRNPMRAAGFTEGPFRSINPTALGWGAVIWDQM